MTTPAAPRLNLAFLTRHSVTMGELVRVVFAIQQGLAEMQKRGENDVVFLLVRRPPQWSAAFVLRSEALEELAEDDIEGRGILGEPAPAGHWWATFVVDEPGGGQHRYFGQIDEQGRMHDPPRYAPLEQTFPRRARGAVRRLRATLAMERKLVVH